MNEQAYKTDAARRRKIRINSWALAAVAVALYLGFIVVQVLRSAGG